MLSSFINYSLQSFFETVGFEKITFSFEKFVLKFYPMETKVCWCCSQADGEALSQAPMYGRAEGAESGRAEGAESGRAEGLAVL